MLEVRNWAEVASWLTLSREISLLLLPLADTRSANRPRVSTLTALLKKLGEVRFVPEV